MTTFVKACWRVMVHPLALDDFDQLREWEIEETLETFQLLRLEDDPRYPKNRRLNVCHLSYDAPNWFRIRALRANVRILFRLVKTSEHRVLELRVRDHADDASQSVQIVRVAPRAIAYGHWLQDRRRRVG